MAEIQNSVMMQPFTPLKNSAFWIHQRQDVYNALVNQRVPTTNLAHSGLDRSSGPTDDFTWAKRTTCLQADCVEFCFGPNAANTEAYNALQRRLDEWYNNKPSHFSPVCYVEENPSQGKYFPDICVLLDHASEFKVAISVSKS